MTRGKTTVFLLVATILAAVLPGRADLIATGFEFPTYVIGSIHNQDGWRAPGPQDEMVTRNGNNYPGWGLQSFRMSNAVISGTFADQVISKPTINETGEIDSINGGFSGGTRVRRFDAQFSFGSQTQIWQPGLSIGVAPDRGDGSPMSLLKIEDEASGIQIAFTQWIQGSHGPGCDPRNLQTSFIQTGLTHLTTHNIRMVLDFIDGPSNDRVLVYVNNQLRATGTSWEDAYRNCAPGGGSRTVDSLNFNATGEQCTACQGNGFVFDNLELRSVGAVITPTTLSVTEGGPPTTYSVRLETPPLDFVRVIPQFGAGITVTPPERVFTPANWNIPQTFTVTAVDDDVPEDPVIVNINHNIASFDGHWDGSPVDLVRVTVNDNDPPYILTETDGVTVVSEQGPTTDFYSFRLFTQPTANVTITASPDAQVTVTPASRTFTPANWNVPQSFTVTAVDDVIDEPDSHFGFITHTAVSADPNYNGPVPSVTATVFDNDPLPPPVPAPIITNCPAAPIDNRTYTFTGTTQPGTAIEMYINGNVAGGVLPDPAGNWSLALTFPGNGTFSVTARATDLGGNRSPFSAVCSVTVNADITPPPIPTIITPAQNAVTGRTVVVSGNAFGDTVEVRLFDGGVQIATLLTTAGPWQTTQQFTSGVHTLTVRALDAAGNISAPSPVRTFTADGDPPQVTIDTPPLTLFVQLGLPFAPWVLQGTASDAHSGIVRMEVEVVNLLTGDTVTEPLPCACPSAPGQLLTWEYHPFLLPGLYRFTVRAFDVINNQGSAVRTVLFVL